MLTPYPKYPGSKVTHLYAVVCPGDSPGNSVISGHYESTLEDAEIMARTYDEIHDGARCTTMHGIYQVNFVNIPREEV